MSINDFLKQIASDILKNKKVLSKNDFYYILKYLGVKQNVSLVGDIKKFYDDFLDSLNNSLVKYDARVVGEEENTTNYIGFYVDKKADYNEAVKVYFAPKYEYMISALKTIFLYLIRNNVQAVVKFHVKATNEGIVIQFYDKKDVMPFINYCNNNFVLKDLLLNVNPFIATIYGIGLVSDNNTIESYNGTLSVVLEEYFKLAVNNEALSRVSDLDFIDFLRKRIKLEEDKSIVFNLKAIEKNIVAILNHENPISEKDLI